MAWYRASDKLPVLHEPMEPLFTDAYMHQSAWMSKLFMYDVATSWGQCQWDITVPLQWRHKSVAVSQITGNSTICETFCSSLE